MALVITVYNKCTHNFFNIATIIVIVAKKKLFPPPLIRYTMPHIILFLFWVKESTEILKLLYFSLSKVTPFRQVFSNESIESLSRFPENEKRSQRNLKNCLKVTKMLFVNTPLIFLFQTAEFYNNPDPLQ